ncbi:MAG: hypothetical protein QM639_17795 [Rhodocyclaceae bacterium]|jgi:hypothetical protein
MSGSSIPHDDGLDFLRKMWGNMGFGMPGMITPTLDTDELERRIADLKAVEGWLKMNLGMLQMTIQGLELQRATLAAVRAMGQAHEAGSQDDSHNPFANAALWAWPFTPPAQDAAAEPNEAPASSAPTDDAATSTRPRSRSK